MRQEIITKYDRYYKVLRKIIPKCDKKLLESVTGITKCDKIITK